MNEISYDIDYFRTKKTNNDILDKNFMNQMTATTTTKIIKLNEQNNFMNSIDDKEDSNDDGEGEEEEDEEVENNEIVNEVYYDDDGEEYTDDENNNNTIDEEYTNEEECDDNDNDDNGNYDEDEDEDDEDNEESTNLNDNDKIQTFLNILSHHVTSTHDNETTTTTMQTSSCCHYICIICKIISNNSNEFSNHFFDKHKMKLSEKQENYYFEKRLSSSSSSFQSVFVLDTKLKLELIKYHKKQQQTNEDQVKNKLLKLTADKSINTFDYDDHHQNSTNVKLLFIDDYNDLVNIISLFKNFYYNDIPVLTNNLLINSISNSSSNNNNNNSKKRTSLKNNKISSTNFLIRNKGNKKTENDLFKFNNNNINRNQLLHSLNSNNKILLQTKLFKQQMKSSDNNGRNKTQNTLSQGLFPNSRQTSFGSTTCNVHPNGRENGIECKNCDLVLLSHKNSCNDGGGGAVSGIASMTHSRNACKKLKCPKCNWHYKYRETLDIHMKEKHTDNVSQCQFCLKQTPHPRLGRGEQYKCGYKPYRCDICDYSTTTKGNLSIHMQSDKHTNNVKEMKNGNYTPPVTQSSSTSTSDSTFVATTIDLNNNNNKRLHDSISTDSNDELDDEIENNCKSIKISVNNSKASLPRKHLNSGRQPHFSNGM